MNSSYYTVQGGTSLHGEVEIPGAKNAVLAMFCAALLTEEECIFENVPDISDVAVMLEIFECMGVKVSRDLTRKTVSVTAQSLAPEKLKDCKLVKKLRASLLILGPLLARTGKATLQQPGGCVLGARPNFIHTDGLETLGAKILRDELEVMELSFDGKLKESRILLSEASVTGTENLAMFLAGQEAVGELYFSAAEPHVCALLHMLADMGAGIEGIKTHHLRIYGKKKLSGGRFVVPSDDILVGTYAVAGVITGGDILIKNVDHEGLYSFYGVLKRMGVNLTMEKKALRIQPSKHLVAIPKIQTAIYPGFPTDLQSPVGVLLTQCEGETVIFETLFENRLAYLTELEKMGAKVEILNVHQARITGPTSLHGAEVQSWDLRAGAAMVLAGLIAEGTTRITNVQYIERGYEDFVETLNQLGAEIEKG